MTSIRTLFLHFSVCAVLLLNTAAFAAPQPSGLHLMPVPRSVTITEGRLSIDGDFKACLTGYPDTRLAASATRFLKRLREKTGIPLDPSPMQDIKQAVLEIQCNGPGKPVQSISADESYTLEVSSRNARLTAASPIGIFRGLETILQLVSVDDSSFYIPCLKIEDSPRFPWRGLLIDVSRHWEPPEVIKRNLDAMAAVKMNVLHWHLSDDQGFRVESGHFPKLHLEGSDGNYYTQEEVKDVVAYARDRGIRVVPEFDMPGHTTAWLTAYPELAAAPGPYRIERSWGVFDPCMDPTRKRVYSFLDSFIEEMAGLFPDEYFHIGGDEVNGKQWNSNARIREFKTQRHMKTNGELQAYFNRQLLRILKKHGKKMIGWDEILQPDLPEDVVIQSWRGQASLAEGARLKYRGILSYGYYLDHMESASFHYLMDPLGKEASSLSENEQSRILGGEACMWGEFVNPDNIDSRIWPRAAAIAERLWSPPDTQDVPDMYRRLEFVDHDLDSLGLRPRENSGRMLRRMAGGQDPGPLKTFAGLLKATSIGVRVRARRYSSSTPLNRLADAVMPESDTARRFESLVDNAIRNGLKSPDLIRQIREQLAVWRDNDTELRPVLDRSFLLAEAKPLSELIADLSKAGLQALDYIPAGQHPPESWQKETHALLDRADKPQAEVLIAITPAIRKLVEAAGTASP